MVILVVGSFKRAFYAPAFYHAWQSLGYRVYKIDSDDYILKGKNPLLGILNRIQEKYHVGVPLLKYNEDIVKDVKQLKPAFVFLYRCHDVFDSTLKKIRKETVIFSYNNDDPFSTNIQNHFKGHYISNSRFCDLVYVYRKKNIEDFRKIGISKTKVLLPYYMSSTNFPISDTDKHIPIAFVGHFEDDGRDEVIKSMHDAGLPVTIYGKDYWITKSKLYNELKTIIKEPKSGAEYNALLNQIQIALVFLSKRNNDTYTRRCFEIPAAKTLMLAPYTRDMDELFPEGGCAVYYRSTDDLIEKCRYLLSHPEDVKRIADAGYERLKIIGGSEIDRCKEIIKDYETIKKRKI